ncbi:hypothetical protein KR044_004107 [Drosophila immigrans]|nr:hypothetical protein KR044_004107 [Drosophila immigrans]
MTTPQLLNRNMRTMPKWVTETKDRTGPPAPPLNRSKETISNMPTLPPKTKSTPEPDYEVIEFSNQQQYSNEPMKTLHIRNKPTINKLKCTLCGSQNPWVTCGECAGQIFCASCDDMFHKHPKRKQHIRMSVEQGTPPIPPKTQGGTEPPVAPPRRNKRGLLTPFLGRKEQILSPPSPTSTHKSDFGWRSTSSKTSSTNQANGSSVLTMSNRPLPDLPREVPVPSEGRCASRSGTPKSVFDSIQRPPSVQLEKIKTKASATLDRMAQLQKRYHQQKAQSQLELDNSSRSAIQHSPNGVNFEHWSNISPSPSHFHSGSMSSGLNSSHFDLSDDSHIFHNSLLLQHHQRQQAPVAQRHQMSKSVFNLNNLNRRPLAEMQNGSANQRMQQTQSMAQLNCAGCHQGRQGGILPIHQVRSPDKWTLFGSQQQFNQSNLSLNMGQNYPHYPPPVFMTQRSIIPHVYPGAAGYPVMRPGVMGMPPTSVSRAASRSRYAASPTPSRKSLSLRRSKRCIYVDDELTDDEDSEQDDRRSLVSSRSGMTSASRAHQNHQRQRRLSSASQLINNKEGKADLSAEQLHANHSMMDRRASVSKSVHGEWLSKRRNSKDRSRTVKTNQVEVPKTSRIYSDLESEGSGTRALVQAKIQQKLQESDEHKTNLTIFKEENTQAAAIVPKVALTPVDVEMTELQVHEINEIEERDGTALANEPNAENTESSPKTNLEDDYLGLPPSTPDHEWECEFCTFVNEANIKICTICCKTPSKPPKRTANKKIESSTDQETNASEATTLKNNNNCFNTRKVKLERKSSLKLTKSQQQVNSTASLRDTSTDVSGQAEKITGTTSTGPDNKLSSVSKSKIKTPSENDSDYATVKGFIHKESVENIWNTLDESIQAQAVQIFKQAEKISDKPPPTELMSLDLSHQGREKVTLPPPQNIYTQTDESVAFTKLSEEQTNLQEPLEPTKIEHPSYHNRRHLFQTTDGHRTSNEQQQSAGLVSRRPNLINELKAIQHQSKSPFDVCHDSAGYVSEIARDSEVEIRIILRELELYNFTVEELEAALKYCGADIHPIQWLRDNWHKLVQTVQSLSTKYGQERAENTIGTISQKEARNALRSSSGNVWQAVADCIQQRQQNYCKLASKGNFLNEDIVNALTAHQGNFDQALLELNRTQLKPFLLRIWGSPNGMDNESASKAIKSDIHDFLSSNALDGVQISLHGESLGFTNPFDVPNVDETRSHSPTKSSFATPSPYQLEDNALKNLEILIGNMEQIQAKQNQEVLRSIETMLVTFKGKSDHETEYETDPEVMRILTKSPISMIKCPSMNTVKDRSGDVKNFVWQHIQDIVPNLVQQVEQELEGKPENVLHVAKAEAEANGGLTLPHLDVPSAGIMEVVVKPILKNGVIHEERCQNYIYATEIANFKLVFDRAMERWHEQEWQPQTFEGAKHLIFNSFMAPKTVSALQIVNNEQQQPPQTSTLQIQQKINATKIDLNLSNDEDNQLEKQNMQKLTVVEALQLNDKTEEFLPSTVILYKMPSINRNYEFKKWPKSEDHVDVEQVQVKSQLTDINEATEGQKAVENSTAMTIFEIEQSNVGQCVLDDNRNHTLEPTIITEEQNEEHPTVKVQTAVLDFRQLFKEGSKSSQGKLTIVDSNETQELEDEEAVDSQIKSNLATVSLQKLSKISDSSDKQFSKIPIRAPSYTDSKNRAYTTTRNLNSEHIQQHTIGLQLEEKLSREQIFVVSPDELATTNEFEEVFEDATDFSTEELHLQDECLTDSEILSLDSDKQLSRSPEKVALLGFAHEKSPQDVSCANSISNAEISIASNHTESEKLIRKEFMPSGDPAKQNLSELVEDTQRLIKQMRDEISINDFESTDDEEYSEYSDEYDNEGEEEEWFDSEDEEEGTYNEEHEVIIEYASSGSEIEDILEENEDSDEHEDGDKNCVTDSAKLVTATSTLSVTPKNHRVIEALDETFTVSQQSVPINLRNLESTEVTTDTHLVDVPIIEKIVEPIVRTILIKDDYTPVVGSGTHAELFQSFSLNEHSESVQPVEPLGTHVSTQGMTSGTDIKLLEPNSIMESAEESHRVDVTMIAPIIEETEAFIKDHELETSSGVPLIRLLKDPCEFLDLKIVSSDQNNTIDQGIIKTMEPSKKIISSDQNNTIDQGIVKTMEPSKSKKLKTTKSLISKIPKPTNEHSSNLTTNKKSAMRSKSFSAPIGISSVKRIQEEYLQKQKQTQFSTVASNSRVPIRSSPSNKKSLSEAIDKFNKSIYMDGPSTSGTAAAVNAILMTTSHRRIPKKKYHETCFSDDDYETSASENGSEQYPDEPLKAELLKRKFSMPVFRAYPNMQETIIEDPTVLAHKYVEQELVSSIAEAQIVATLVHMKFQEDVALWAAKECSDLDQAISLLQQECELCMNTYSMNQIVSMLKCTHKCCKQCAKSYFTVQITDRSINDCSCPFCKLPELSNEVEHEDEHLEYFSNLDIFLKSILDIDVHELFQRKLRDRTLQRDPNFKWCIQCASGFFARPKQKRLICPDCGSVTCALCRKPWEKQHEGTSCEAYLEWKIENDPELQAQGVQEHLAQNGIDCPKCKFRYSLARGGCMHFTCTQCKFEFCYGCAKPFMMGAKCNISLYCGKLGLHAHHPRNCLFYLRDKIPMQLQFLLKEHNVQFDTEPRELQDEPTSSAKARALVRCPIPLQKETPQGLVDTFCNGDVSDKHAGMCRTHYVEYLAGKVAKASIDPLPIFDLTDCVQELRRRGIALPERGPWDTDEIYKNMCSEVIKQRIPLNPA